MQNELIFENFVPNITQYMSVVNESFFDFLKKEKNSNSGAKTTNIIYTNGSYSITATNGPDSIVFRAVDGNDVFYIWSSKKKSSISVMFSNVSTNKYYVPKCDIKGNGLPPFMFDRQGLIKMNEYNNEYNKNTFRDEITFLMEIVKYCQKNGTAAS